MGGVEVVPPWLVLAANALGCNVDALAGATLSDKNTNFWRGTFMSNSDYGAAGVTAAEAVEAVPGPPALMAATVNV